MPASPQSIAAFRDAREFLLRNRNDPVAAAGFRWPRLDNFNWALDWFDAELASGDLRDSPGADHHRRRCGPVELRRVVGPLQPGGERAARAWRAPRRPHPADARQRGAVVGGDAGGDEARRRGGAGDHSAHRAGPRRAGAPRPRPPGGHLARGCAEARRPARHGHPHHRRRRGRGLRRLRNHAGRRPRVQARWPDRRRRSAAAVFHLRHHRHAEAGAAQPRSAIPSATSATMYCARAAAGRRAPEHLLARLGQARMELRVRALDRRRRGVHRQPAALQCARHAGRDRRWRRHHAVRAADGVAHVHPGGSEILEDLPARGLRRRRAAEPRGDRPGP